LGKKEKKRISALESKLRAQENPYTSLSQQRFKGNSCANTNPPGKRGDPVDHHKAPPVHYQNLRKSNTNGKEKK
jgi:hypothetical protein